MKVTRILGKGLFWIFILAILLCPVVMIFELSEQEMEAYKPPKSPVILDYAYGDVKQVHRGDLNEFVAVSGSYTCKEYGYMELNYKDASAIRWEVNNGEVVSEGQVLGYYNGKAVKSTHTGRIREMQTYGEDSYIQFQLFSPVVLECALDDTALRTLQRSNELKTAEGNVVTVAYCAPIRNADGTTTVHLSVDGTSGTYGTAEKALRVYTGRTYSGVLMVDADCVYQRADRDDETWYVRSVSQNGVFLDELVVQIGYSDGETVCVTGVPEGTYLDSGYKFVLEGGQ